MYPSSSDGLNKETDDAVYFFTTAFHPFDNFSAHHIRIWGQTFPTLEHAYQWKKFSTSNPEIAEKILDAPSPHVVKEISESHEAPKEWHARKVEVMEELLFAKAKQHEDMRDALTRSGNRVIIENSPVDDFWGSGPHGKGENMIGKILMKIRNMI